MLPLNAIPTEVIRKSLVPYQGFVMPFEIALSPRDRSGLKYIQEPITRLEPAMQAELRKAFKLLDARTAMALIGMLLRR